MLGKLRDYGASKDELKSFYCATQLDLLLNTEPNKLLHGNLTNEQHDTTEMIQKRGLRIIYHHVLRIY